MQKLNNVFIIYSTPQIHSMFTTHGWNIVDNICDADLVQFTGGATDVNPKLYGETRYKKTYISPDRDDKEAIVFKMASKLKIPMAGICRGGQFLNVMLGGKILQEINNHVPKNDRTGHIVQDTRSGEYYQASSTHHQMMIPNKKLWHNVFLIAREATIVQKRSKEVNKWTYAAPIGPDIEGIFYKDSQVLCFQPHPEYDGYKDLRVHYFDYLEEFLKVGIWKYKERAVI